MLVSDFSAQEVTKAAVEGHRLTRDVYDHSAGFRNDHGPPGHVPAVDAHVVVGVSRPARHQAHVDSGAARTANAGEGNGT